MNHVTSASSALYYLGIDGGGTSTRALICDQTGHVRGFAKSDSSNILHAGQEKAAQALRDAIGKAADQANVAPNGFTATFLGLAGIVNPDDQQSIRDLIAPMKLSKPDAIGVDHDIRIALTGGVAGAPGIALISGTGSACYGRNEAGEKHQCGGHEFLADDVGAGGWIGRQALKAAVRQADGRENPTALKELVFDFLGIHSIEYFIHRVHVQELNRTQLAEIAPLVLDLAETGDSAAVRIRQAAINELTNLVTVTARELQIENSARVIFAGGVACSETIQSRLQASVEKSLPQSMVVPPITDPTGGAALEAIRLSGISLTNEIAEQLNNRPQTQ